MGVISIEHSDRLFWLGRYTERVFTTLKALEKQYDSMIDDDPMLYTEFLQNFGLDDTYGNMQNFVSSFLFDKTNPYSVAYSLEKAYDNGIVLRENISSKALSFLQLAKDTLAVAFSSQKGLLFSLLPLEDSLFAFWGCINEYIYDDEIITLLMCGKYVERLDLYFRLKYDIKFIKLEFERLCDYLKRVPENTSYRYNAKYLNDLSEIIDIKENYTDRLNDAVKSLGNLFLKEK
jgi:uncharacterized alpha-E superfamily protein